jgi:hypothetical protein
VGPTASRSVSRQSSQDISTELTVIDLASANAQLTISYSARIMAFASIQVRNPSADPREVRCALRISDGESEGNVGQEYVADLPAQDGFDITASLQGAASKSPGTYDVRMICHEATGQSLEAVRANLAVFASDG